MYTRYTVAIMSCILTIGAGMGRAQVGGGSATTPVSGAGLSPLTPASSRQNTLVPSRPDVTWRDQNLVITGNVPGGRHFRGPVPYGSASSLGAGSDIAAPSPVDSFIRRSAGLPYTDRNPANVQRFYEPRTTAGSLSRNGMLELTPPGAASLQGTSRNEINSSLPLGAAGIYRPRSMLSMSAAELERLSGIDMLTDAARLPTDLRLQQPGKLPTEPILRPRDLQVKTRIEKEPTNSPLEQRAIAELPVPLEPDAPLSNEIQELKALLESDLAAYDRTRAKKTAAEPQEQEQWTTKQPAEPTAGNDVDLAETQTRATTDAEESSTAPTETDPAGEMAPLNSGEKRMVRGILGEHGSYEELAAAKVKEFAGKADALLKEGKYYKAIDAYVLGLIWDKRTPHLNLHRAIAHFCAGEFVSAALFLERAVVLEPSYASDKVDLAGLLPSKDVIDDQIIEGAEWQKESGSGEIAMLLAWVCQQHGRTARAADYVKIAQQKMPASFAAAAIAKALADK